jgi:hypothetical protein
MKRCVIEEPFNDQIDALTDLQKRPDPPHRLVEAEIIDPAALSPAQWDAVLHRLYILHKAIFSGVSIQKFSCYLTRADAVRTRIQIYRNEGGALVGYCAIHFLEIQRKGEVLGILRAEAGLLAGYRGTGMTLWFGAKEALRYKALHPFRTVALFAMPVHPSSYHMFSKYFWKCYPYPGRRIPRRWLALLLDLAQSSGVEAVDPSDPMVRRVGWVTIESEADVASWRTSSHEDVQFYLSRNPKYAEGNGLAFIAPLSTGNFIVSLIQYLWHCVVLLVRYRRLGYSR